MASPSLPVGPSRVLISLPLSPMNRTSEYARAESEQRVAHARLIAWDAQLNESLDPARYHREEIQPVLDELDPQADLRARQAAFMQHMSALVAARNNVVSPMDEYRAALDDELHHVQPLIDRMQDEDARRRRDADERFAAQEAYSRAKFQQQYKAQAPYLMY